MEPIRKQEPKGPLASYYKAGQVFFVDLASKMVNALSKTKFQVEVKNKVPFEITSTQMDSVKSELEKVVDRMDYLPQFTDIRELISMVLDMTDRNDLSLHYLQEAVTQAIVEKEMPEGKEDVRVTNLSEIPTYKEEIEELNNSFKKFAKEVESIAKKQPLVKVDAPDMSGVESAVRGIPHFDGDSFLGKLDESLTNLKDSISKIRINVAGGGGIGKTNNHGDLRVQIVDSNGNELDPQGLGDSPVVGQKQITGSASALGSQTSVKNGFIIQALSTNSDVCYIGGSGVTSTDGYELQAGQATSIAVRDLSAIYVTGTSGDKVCYISST